MHKAPFFHFPPSQPSNSSLKICCVDSRHLPKPHIPLRIISPQTHNPNFPFISDGSILVNEIHIPRPQRISSHEILITRRSFVFRVPRQHALDAHADAFHILNGRPALRTEEIEADVAVGVDMRVDGDGAWWGGEVRECYFGGFCGVVREQ